jgi:hypothetical protein
MPEGLPLSAPSRKRGFQDTVIGKARKPHGHNGRAYRKPKSCPANRCRSRLLAQVSG